MTKPETTKLSLMMAFATIIDMNAEIMDDQEKLIMKLQEDVMRLQLELQTHDTKPRVGQGN